MIPSYKNMFFFYDEQIILDMTAKSYMELCDGFVMQSCSYIFKISW